METEITPVDTQSGTGKATGTANSKPAELSNLLAGLHLPRLSGKSRKRQGHHHESILSWGAGCAEFFIHILSWLLCKP